MTRFTDDVGRMLDGFVNAMNSLGRQSCVVTIHHQTWNRDHSASTDKLIAMLERKFLVDIKDIVMAMVPISEDIKSALRAERDISIRFTKEGTSFRAMVTT